ncbi:MAG: DUF3857 domain-containing protein [Gammaproteobacteria bacterium]|nr:DUF3857 domain-containing protein [Gammaproteobacteria bacterium]
MQEDQIDQIVSIVFVLILIYPIWKCWKISRRETTSAICVYSLLLVLSGLLVPLTNKLITDCKVSSILSSVLGIGSVLLFIAAMSLAIIGLIAYKKNPTFIQGRKQAIAALACSVIFLSIPTIIITKYVQNKADQLDKGEWQEFNDLNCKYKFPGQPYVIVNAKKINPYASFVMLKSNPYNLVMIIADKTGLRKSNNSASLLEHSIATLKSTATTCRIVEQKQRSINGIEGIMVKADIVINDDPMIHVLWVAVKNGYSYQLVAMGHKRDSEYIKEKADLLFANFEIIDDKQIYYSKGAGPFGSFTSEIFDYTMDLNGTSWKKWKDFESYFATAEVGASINDDISAVVIPIHYATETPSLDGVTQALLKCIEIEYPNNKIKELHSINEANMHGHIFDYEKESNGTWYDFRLKVLSGSDRGYLIAAIAPKGTSERDKLFEEVFNNIHFNTNDSLPFDLTNLTPSQRKKEAEINNWIGLFYYNAKQFSTCLKFFKLSMEMNPEGVVYLTNIMDAYDKLQQHDEALVYLSNYDEMYKENQNVLSWKAWNLINSERSKDALKIYEELFNGNYRNDENFTAFVYLLSEEKEWEAIDMAFDKYLKSGDSVGLMLVRAELLNKQGNYKVAIQTLEEFQKTIPFNAQIAYSLIQNCNAIEQYNRTLEICETLIKEGFTSADSYYYKGEAEYNLKWYRQSKQSFEEALKFAPKENGIHDYIAHISSLLGEGNNSAVKDPITPVKIPEIISEKLPSQQATLQEDGYDSYYLNYVKGFAFNKENEFKCTTYRHIKVLDAGAVSAFSTFEIDFKPNIEKVYVNELIVRNKEGEIVSRGNPSDYFIIDKQNGMMATEDKTLNIPVSHLLPGHTVELTTTVKRINNCEKIPFQKAIMSTQQPILLSALFYEGDPEAIQYEAFNTPMPEEIKNGLAWIIENPPIYNWEPSQAEYKTFLPAISINSSKQDWQALGKEYLRKIENKLVLEETTRDLAKQLVGEKKNHRETIDILSRYVQTKYTYKAIEFGIHAQIPNTAIVTTRHKYGDCKDHAVLLHQLLKSVSIKSHLVLVNTATEAELKLPSLEQFDHMILYIPDEKGGRFVDTTDKGIDLNLVTPSNLGGRHAFILDGDRPRFAMIPYYENVNNGLYTSRTLEIINSTNLKITEKVQLTGYVAGFMRTYIKSIAKSNRFAWAQNFISNYYSTAKLKDFQVLNLYDNSKELILNLDYEIAQLCKKTGDRLNFKIPGLWEHYYLDAQPVKDRKTPFKIQYPLNFESKVTVKAPIKNVFQKVDDLKKKDQSAFGQWQTIVIQNPELLELNFSCQLKAGVFDPSQYPSYQSTMEQAVTSISGKEFLMVTQ